MNMKVKKLYADAVIPTRATGGAAGYDLSAYLKESVIIRPNAREKIPTGICCAVPEGCAGLIYSRSGLSFRHGIHLANGVGVIDSDYRGELCVTLHNCSERDFEIHHGDRIAQLVITPVLTPELVLCDNLDNTDRGINGFGSTGIQTLSEENNG
ncbi:MAG: dUTP diphosphatase [Clostridia bacterium]|nr:dUTP diphosphatase [Clostridia bacterium]